MLSIRWRLALNYAVAMALFLMAFGAIVYGLIQSSQISRIDFELEEELTEVTTELNEAFAGEPYLDELRQHFAEHAQYEFEISDRDGQSWFRSTRLGQQRLRIISEQPAEPPRIAQRVIPQAGEYRVLTEQVTVGQRELVVQIAIPLQPVREVQAGLLRTFLIAGPLVLLVATLGGYLLASRAMAPVREMTRRAEHITAQDLHQRLEVGPVRDELSDLGRTLNEMIARLERAFDDTRRFTANAAHELRTPLTVIRTQLDVALRGDRSAAEWRRLLTSIHEDVTQMSGLVSDLLELARADSGSLSLNCELTDLTRLLSDCFRPLAERAEARSLHVDWAVELPERVEVDRRWLRLVLSNLLENAVDYSNIGGSVRIAAQHCHSHLPGGLPPDAEPDSEWFQITIANSGCVLSPESAADVFKRFWRGDPARTASSTHSGLGLSLCQQLIEAMRGGIQVTVSAGQFLVAITLPCGQTKQVMVGKSGRAPA